MVNVQQPEMRRSEHNPTVTDSKVPGPGSRPKVKGGGSRPVPPEQVSPYGPASRPVAEHAEHSDERGHEG